MVLTLARISPALDFERLRSSYERGCQYDLDAAPGARTAAGLLATGDATPEEVDLALNLLARKVRRAPLGDDQFASFLFEVAYAKKDVRLDTLFLEYVRRPGNEPLLRIFLGEVATIVKLEVVFSNLADDVLAERLRLVIGLVRENPTTQGPVWDRAMIDFFRGEAVNSEEVLGAVERYAEIPALITDAVELVSEVKRPVKYAVPTVRTWMGHALTIRGLADLVTGIRLDQWVRSEAGLNTPPEIEAILRRIGLIGQKLTYH